MDLLTKRLKDMKVQTELSEERIIKFESALRGSKRNLENALQEKGSLTRRIEAVESQIINADKRRQELAEKMKELERATTASEGKRKFLQNKELDGDQAILQMEESLNVARSRFDENSIKCEEAEIRLASLKEEYAKAFGKRTELEDTGRSLQADVDQKVLRVRDMEELELKSSKKNRQVEEELKLLDSHYQHEMERAQRASMNIQTLKRLIEGVQDEIETVQIRTKATKVALQNTMQAVDTK